VTPGCTFLSCINTLSIGVTFIVIGLLGEYVVCNFMVLNNSPSVHHVKVNLGTYIDTIVPTWDREAV